MAARDTIDQLKAHIERLRRDSLDVVANASRIVFEGVQKLAEQELRALNDYYKSAVNSAKAASGPGDLASQQLDLLQDTVQKVIAAARESLSIIADTRAELTRLVSTGADTQVLTKVTAPAQKAIEDVKKAAAKAQATAARTAAEVKKTLEKELAVAEKKGKAAVRQTEVKAREVGKVVKNRLGSVLDITPPPAVAKKAVTAKPSPDSRAARAASLAKKPAKPATATKSATPPRR
jgi:hypothetical protein